MTSYFIFHAYFYDYLLSRHEIASSVSARVSAKYQNNKYNLFLEFVRSVTIYEHHGHCTH